MGGGEGLRLVSHCRRTPHPRVPATPAGVRTRVPAELSSRPDTCVRGDFTPTSDSPGWASGLLWSQDEPRGLFYSRRGDVEIADAPGWTEMVAVRFVIGPQGAGVLLPRTHGAASPSALLRAPWDSDRLAPSGSPQPPPAPSPSGPAEAEAQTLKCSLAGRRSAPPPRGAAGADRGGHARAAWSPAPRSRPGALGPPGAPQGFSRGGICSPGVPSRRRHAAPTRRTRSQRDLEFPPRRNTLPRGVGSILCG